jgi:hypothetical protein
MLPLAALAAMAMSERPVEGLAGIPPASRHGS